MNAQVLGISIDHVPCLKAWAESLGGVTYPLLSDFWPHGKIAEMYGVLREEGYTERALFVIDKEGVIRFIDIHNIDLQPDNEELRDVIRRVDPDAAEREKRPKPAELPHGGVVIYCTPWCPDCRRAKIWLKDHKVPYREVDIFSSPGAEGQVRLWNKGELVTPTFDLDGDILSDFVEEVAIPKLTPYIPKERK